MAGRSRPHRGDDPLLFLRGPEQAGVRKPQQLRPLTFKDAEEMKRNIGRAGGKKGRKGGRRVVIDREKVKALWAQGLKYPVIAERLGIAISSVSRILKLGH